MSIKFNTRILQHISKQISSGKVIWALLTLNEYQLSENDPLLKCLRNKAMLAAKENPRYQEIPGILSAVLSGKKYSELGKEQQSDIRTADARTEVNYRYSKKIALTDFSRRKLIRQAGGNVYFSRPSSLCSSRKRSYALVNSTKREASSGD